MLETTVASKCRPIIFSAESVRAILAGQKTVTRRVVVNPPAFADAFAAYYDASSRRWAWYGDDDSIRGPTFPCPYGHVGDRLWVKHPARISGRSANGFLVTDEGFDDPPPNGRFFYWHKFAHKVPAEGKRFGRGWPRVLSRLTLEITGVRVERVHDITEADAIAEGFTPRSCAKVFNRAAGRHGTFPPCYVEDDEGNDGGESYCYSCAAKEARKHGGDHHSKGWGDYPETDGPAYCEGCGRVLQMSLTRYGVERELRIEDDPDGKKPGLYPVRGRDARIVHVIADGIGDLRDEHQGRLAQIGFATAWDGLNAARGFPWSSNPFVWCVTFRRVEPEATDA